MVDLHNVVKVTLGAVVVPLGIILNQIWPKWTRATLPIRIITGILVLPFALIVWLMVKWWDKY